MQLMQAPMRAQVLWAVFDVLWVTFDDTSNRAVTTTIMNRPVALDVLGNISDSPVATLAVGSVGGYMNAAISEPRDNGKSRSRGGGDDEEYDDYEEERGGRGGGNDENDDRNKVMYGHIVREEFPGGVEEVKEWLSRVRGNLVDMPLDFLVDVDDIAKEGLELNSLTQELYT